MSTPNDPYSVPPEPGQPPLGYGPPPGYGPPGYGAGPSPYGPPTQTSTKAVVALVLAIASFAVCPVVPAIVALVLASGARAEIHASGGRLTGDGLVTAAKVIAWINLGLAVAAVVVLLIGVALLGGTHSGTY